MNQNNFVIVRHRINNLRQFQNEFEKATDMLKKAGVMKAWINRNLDDPNEVIAVMQCNDLQKYRQWTQSSDYRTCLQNAGATQSQYTFMEELSATPVPAHVS
jgi:uncharacterized protein (DUF1330 family)